MFNVCNVWFRFSISDGTAQGSKEKESRDYYNTIFTISKELERYMISFDFQQYFIPFKPTWRECHSESFFIKAKSEFEKNLLAELEWHYAEQKAFAS